MASRYQVRKPCKVFSWENIFHLARSLQSRRRRRKRERERKKMWSGFLNIFCVLFFLRRGVFIFFFLFFSDSSFSLYKWFELKRSGAQEVLEEEEEGKKAPLLVLPHLENRGRWKLYPLFYWLFTVKDRRRYPEVEKPFSTPTKIRSKGKEKNVLFVFKEKSQGQSILIKSISFKILRKKDAK